jgi:uncharacterized protein YdcH (DUF465 family)
MNDEQFTKLIETIENLNDAIRNLDSGTGDKRRVKNAEIERDLFERKQLEEEAYEHQFDDDDNLLDYLKF